MFSANFTIKNVLVCWFRRTMILIYKEFLCKVTAEFFHLFSFFSCIHFSRLINIVAYKLRDVIWQSETTGHFAGGKLYWKHSIDVGCHRALRIEYQWKFDHSNPGSWSSSHRFSGIAESLEYFCCVLEGKEFAILQSSFAFDLIAANWHRFCALNYWYVPATIIIRQKFWWRKAFDLAYEKRNEATVFWRCSVKSLSLDLLFNLPQKLWP